MPCATMMMMSLRCCGVCVAGQVVAWVLSQLTLSPWEQAGAAGVTPLMLAAQAGATAVLQAMLVRPTYHRCSGHHGDAALG